MRGRIINETRVTLMLTHIIQCLLFCVMNICRIDPHVWPCPRVNLDLRYGTVICIFSFALAGEFLEDAVEHGTT